LRPDVIVVDISMPLLNGIDAVRQINKANDKVKIVFLTMHPDVTYAVSAFEAGASGYVLKHSAPTELVIAIRSALHGKTFVTPLLAGEFMRQTKERSTQRDVSTRLTGRQREIVQLLAEGKSAKDIAELLNISSRTVEFHKYRVMKDLGLKSTAELVHYAVRHGIITK
jgi:DNA-binding NarL/FixJ family response regulator